MDSSEYKKFIQSNYEILSDRVVFRLYQNIMNTQDFSFLGSFNINNSDLIINKLRFFDFVPSNFTSSVTSSCSGDISCLMALDKSLETAYPDSFEEVEFKNDSVLQRIEYSTLPFSNENALKILRYVYPNSLLFKIPLETPLGFYNNVLFQELVKLGYEIPFNGAVGDNIFGFLFQKNGDVKIRNLLQKSITPQIDMLLKKANNDCAIEMLTRYYGVERVELKKIEQNKICDRENQEKLLQNLMHLRTQIQSGLKNFEIPGNLCFVQYVNLISNLSFCYGKHVYFDSNTVFLSDPIDLRQVEKPINFCVKFAELCATIFSTLTFDQLSNYAKNSSFDEKDINYLIYHMMTANHFHCTFICALVLKYKFNLEYDVNCINLWFFFKRMISEKKKIKLSCCGVLEFELVYKSPFDFPANVKMNMNELKNAIQFICSNLQDEEEFFHCINMTSLPRITCENFLKSYPSKDSLIFYFVIFQLLKCELASHERSFVEFYVDYFLENENASRYLISPPSEYNKELVDAIYFWNPNILIETPHFLNKQEVLKLFDEL